MHSGLCEIMGGQYTKGFQNIPKDLTMLQLNMKNIKTIYRLCLEYDNYKISIQDNKWLLEEINYAQWTIESDEWALHKLIGNFSGIVGKYLNEK